MKENTFTATIYCGLQEGYTGPIHSIDEVYTICQRYVDKVKWCVTVTPTTFIYTRGKESGVIVGIIQYPRFPLSIKQIRGRALTLASRLKDQLRQERVSIVYPDQTVVIGEKK